MRRRRLALAVVLAAAMPAAAFGQGFGGAPLPPPQTVTPEGPATLVSDWTGSNTLEGNSPKVLTGFKVTVGRGSRAGRVRFRAQETPESPVLEGAAVTLPAEPGTYTFPAPRVPWDYRDGVLGLTQETGGHAIVGAWDCGGEGNTNCTDQTLTIHRTPLVPRKLGGRFLTIEGATERDLDEDLAGDLTDDQTELRTSAAIERLGDGRLAITITIRNAGRRSADQPLLDLRLSPSGGPGRWAEPCVNFGDWRSIPAPPGVLRCPLAAIRPGETRSVQVVVPDPGPLVVSAVVTFEGPDASTARASIAAP